MTGRPVELSVVIPFLNEEDSLPLLYERLRLEALPPDTEFVFVSDGSTDASEALVEGWAARDPRVRLASLTRNFGHQAAICAGLDHARGRFVGVMDADLQDTPEVLLGMYREARDGGWDVVYSVRSKRQDPWPKRAAYKAFYRAYAFLAESPVDVDSGDFCVLSRRAVEALAALPERVRFMRGLRSWTGLRSKPFPTDRAARAAGSPRYSWTKLFSLALEGLTAFSAKPLRVATLCGLGLCGLALLMAAWYVFSWFYHDLHGVVPGFATIVILILLSTGLQLLMLGIVGEYISQIFREVKRRPLYLVRRGVNLAEPPRDPRP